MVVPRIIPGKRQVTIEIAFARQGWAGYAAALRKIDESIIFGYASASEAQKAAERIRLCLDALSRDAKDLPKTFLRNTESVSTAHLPPRPRSQSQAPTPDGRLKLTGRGVRAEQLKIAVVSGPIAHPHRFKPKMMGFVLKTRFPTGTIDDGLDSGIRAAIATFKDLFTFND